MQSEAIALEPCVYCGDAATELDHVVPRVFRRMMEAIDAKYVRTVPDTVPACGECNSIGGGRVFPTFTAKREFIRGRLRAKYAHDLAAPSWADHELERLGSTMRMYVDGGIARQDHIRRRLSWRGAPFERHTESKSEPRDNCVCVVCEQSFKAGKRNAMYCSDDCARVVHRARMLAQEPERTCTQCGCRYIGFGLKFCSRTCSHRHRFPAKAA